MVGGLSLCGPNFRLNALELVESPCHLANAPLEVYQLNLVFLTGNFAICHQYRGHHPLRVKVVLECLISAVLASEGLEVDLDDMPNLLIDGHGLA